MIWTNSDIIDGTGTIDMQWETEESDLIDIEEDKDIVEWIVELDSKSKVECWSIAEEIEIDTRKEIISIIEGGINREWIRRKN